MVDCGDLLIVIPARGGSKRLPKKNVLPLAGKPLICWTIETALKAGLRARIIVTSDDEEILTIAGRYADQGVIAHKRPNALATDMATTAGAIKEVVESEQKAGHTPDAIVLLQPTSPLRTAGDVLDAVHIFRKGGCKDTVVSVCEVDHPIDWVGSVDDDNKFIGVSPSYKRSQDYQKEYRLNGAVYVARADVLLNSHSLFTESLRASVMPRIRSFDIDEEVDFRLCESLIVDG